MTAAAIPAAGAPALAGARAPSLALAPPPAPETASAHVFVIPAYNEEENIPRLLADLEARPALFPPGSRVLIVDDGSQDRTVEVCEAYDGPVPLEVVQLGRNQGPGAAFRAGFAAALQTPAENALVITLEADTTSDLDALPTMIARAEAGADVVLASWVMVNVKPMRRLLSAGAGLTVRILLGVEAKTVSSFFRVYRGELLQAASDRFGERLIRERGFACKAEILAKLARIGARIEEVPVELDSTRREGESKMPIFRTILAYWRMLARARLARGAAPA